MCLPPSLVLRLAAAWRVAAPDAAALAKWEAGLRRAVDPFSRVGQDSSAGAAEGGSAPGSSPGSRGGSHGRSGSRGRPRSGSFRRGGRSRSGSKARAEAAAAALAGNTVAMRPGLSPAEVPTRFLVGCGMDEAEARRRWGLTHAWRAEVCDNVLFTSSFSRDSLSHFLHT